MNNDALKTWSEYMNMHAVNTCKQWRKCRCTCVLQVCHKRNTLDCTMICAYDEEYAHEYLHGNNLWNISRSVYRSDADILVLTCTKTWSEYMNKHVLKTWSEYMNMHAVNTCKQCINYRCTCVLQVCHKRNTLECTMICAHDEEYAHDYLHGNN